MKRRINGIVRRISPLRKLLWEIRTSLISALKEVQPYE